MLFSATIHNKFAHSASAYIRFVHSCKLLESISVDAYVKYLHANISYSKTSSEILIYHVALS